MKKLFVPVFFFLFLSCSSDGFESQIAASAQKDGYCRIITVTALTAEADTTCYANISKKLCEEIGGEATVCRRNPSSSSEESSSSIVVIGGSSSSVLIGGGSSSSVLSGGGSSSSVLIGDGSSSSGALVSSNSVDVSSSSTDAPSSSSNSVSSSSSVVASSSSLGPPDLDCSQFPYYVAKTKKEYINNLASLKGNTTGCGNITYSLGNSSSSLGDSISFAAYSAGSTQNLTITAKVICQNQGPPQTVTQPCPISVFVAEDYRDAKCNHEEVLEVNMNAIKSTTTVIEYACCESKNGYFITCANVNYNLKVRSSQDSTKTSNGGNANLPAFAPIAENNAVCNVQKNGYPDPRGILYRYPERILMTVTNSVPNGGFSCNSW